jgi:hypothetical protein
MSGVKSLNVVLLYIKKWSRETYSLRRSQWQRGIRHVLCLLARKTGSWVRIPQKTWMFGVSVCMCVCVCMRLFCVCAVLCLDRGLATGWSPVQGDLPSVNETEISLLLQSGSKRREGERDILIKTCLSVCVYSVFVLSCVRSGLWQADPPFKESYWLSTRLKISKLILNGEQAREPNPSRKKKLFIVTLICFVLLMLTLFVN